MPTMKIGTPIPLAAGSLLVVVLAGCGGSGGGSVARPDVTPPQLLSTSPIDGAVGFALNEQITATFSEALDPASVTPVSFVVLDAGRNNVNGALAVVGNTVSFTPLVSLQSGEIYEATITTAITDRAGNALVSGATWSFRARADRWETISSTNPPTARTDHTAVWTGNEMIIWGGFNGTNFPADGKRYDAQLDEWNNVATAGAPVARSNHTAVWTGDRMIVWGGTTSFQREHTGGIYTPPGGTGPESWINTSLIDVPLARESYGRLGGESG